MLCSEPEQDKDVLLGVFTNCALSLNMTVVSLVWKSCWTECVLYAPSIRTIDHDGWIIDHDGRTIDHDGWIIDHDGRTFDSHHRS